MRMSPKACDKHFTSLAGSWKFRDGNRILRRKGVHRRPPAGEQAGDTFASTVFFDPKEAPVNYSIFGPKFTFTGQMVEGEITIG